MSRYVWFLATFVEFFRTGVRWLFETCFPTLSFYFSLLVNNNSRKKNRRTAFRSVTNTKKTPKNYTE